MASAQSLVQKHYLFQINPHVQASIMLLSIMDGAELDLNNTLLSSSSISSSSSDDYEKGSPDSRQTFLFAHELLCIDLRLAAELGRCLLERNHELQNYIHLLQKQLDDKHSDMTVRRTEDGS